MPGARPNPLCDGAGGRWMSHGHDGDRKAPQAGQCKAITVQVHSPRHDKCPARNLLHARTHTRMHAMYFFYFCAVVKHTRQKIHHSNRFQASSSAAPSTSTLSGSCPHRHLRNFLVLPN